MKKKIAEFLIAHARRAAPGVTNPANDNRPCIRGEAVRTRPRLACRWSTDSAGRLGCHWALEAPDDPRPLPHRSRRNLRKTVSSLSYQGRVAGPARRPATRLEAGRNGFPASTVLHARH